MLLGAVGAYDWNGTVVMHTAGGSVVAGKAQLSDPKTEAGYKRLAGYIGECTHADLMSSLKMAEAYLFEETHTQTEHVLQVI